MGFFRAPNRPYPKSRPRPRLRLLLFLILVYACIKLLPTPSPPIFRHPHTPSRPPPPIILAGTDDGHTLHYFNGVRVRGNGTYLDLGDRRTSLPGSLLARFFPDELILPSCLTQPTPSFPTPGQPTPKPLPIRDDWPGFYGAPWTARVNGNLIALLHVYAPRNGSLPVAPTEFQIYPDYNGEQTTPAFSLLAPATFIRGSKAVLYRVFLNGPVRCLDLVVQNGENNGIGHLYYQKYHHYYKVDTTFQIQP